MVTPNNQERKEETELTAIATAAGTTTTTNGNNDSNNEKKKNNCSQVGIHGVRLKRFEQVVAKLLSSVEPHYVHLPPPIPILSTTYNANDNDNDNNNDDNDDWPFSSLPRSARVVGNNHPNLKRAQRKEGQLKSMLQCILRLIPPPNNSTNTTNSTSSNTTTDDCCSCDEINPVGVGAATTKTTTKITTIVDFGGGSGHLGIPLALLLPNCRIVVVDLNRRSIDLLHDKAASVIKEIESETDPERQKRYTTDFITTSSSFQNNKNNERYNNTNNPLIRCCGGNTCSDGDDSDSDGRIRILDNLYTFCGPVQDFVEPFDMAIALHLCGEATDVCLRKAINAEAASIIVAPCCVGKLSKKVLNPDVYHATGQNNATVTYPQSDLFCRLISPTTTTKDDNNDNSNKQEEEDWNALAKAADYSNENEFGTSRNASRRTAKALLETDRMLFLENNMYKTALMKMQPLNVTPKNDILVAWRPQVYDDTTAKRKRSPNNTVNIQELFSTPDIECKADIEVTKSHLLLLPVDNNDSNATCTTAITTNSTSPQKVVDRNDWTNDEEEEIKRTILEFLNRDDNDDSTDEVMVFPTRMGGRKRKLIHFVAGKLNVAHWNKGKKHSEKTVAIARRGTTEIK